VDTYLFDVDGTLVDSRQPILLALNSALSASGLAAIDADQLWLHVGPPLHSTLETLLAERGEDTMLIPRLIEDYRAAYQPISVEMALTYPGIVELLDSLDGLGRLGVVTSKPLVYAEPILHALGFVSTFEVIEGPGLTKIESKPLTMARALARLAETADIGALTMIGDRRHDIEAGGHHSATTIGVTWGFGSREELTEAGADHIVDHPDEILAVLTRE